MSLRIMGNVSPDCKLSFEDLQTFPQVEDVSREVEGRQGSAVRLRNVLEQAGYDQAATHATLESNDGFKASVPLEDVLDALLVYRIGDKPLPPELGGPIRFLIPDAAACHTGGADTCANVKHVASIKLTIGEEPDSRSETAHG